MTISLSIYRKKIINSATTNIKKIFISLLNTFRKNEQTRMSVLH